MGNCFEMIKCAECGKMFLGELTIDYLCPDCERAEAEEVGKL